MFTHKENGFQKILSYVSDGKLWNHHHKTIYNNITKHATLIESKIKFELSTVSHSTKDPVLPLCQVSVDCCPAKATKGSFYGETINFFHHPHTAERIIEKYKPYLNLLVSNQHEFRSYSQTMHQICSMRLISWMLRNIPYQIPSFTWRTLTLPLSNWCTSCRQWRLIAYILAIQ